MDKFNTHGGYFAPQGLLKINEGGKHDENPNGGVQLGVDQQGVPNLVEEGEIVYKDFVYSDNIKAKKEILEQFNIPTKYADKLYSDIANAYCDEAEEQLDPITTNGLNVMLGRLAEAQEEQKRQEEERALMEELKNMSPEDIAALEQIMAQEAAAQQQQQAVPGEQVQPEVAPEVVAPEQVAPEVPMMANGGPIYYGISGPLKTPEYLALEDNAYPNELIGPQYNLPFNTFDSGGRKGHPVRKALNTFFNGPEGLNKMEVWVQPNEGSFLKRIPGSIARIGKNAKAFQMNPEAAYDAAYAASKGASRAGKWIGSTIGLTGLGAGLGWAIDAFSNPDIPDGPTEYEYDPNDFACGGKVNRYDWGSFMDTLNNYGVSRNPGGIAGRYKIDTSFPLNGYKDIASLENSDNYKAFTNFVLANPTNENVLEYLKALDAGTNANVSKLFDESGNLREGWDKLYADRRTDKLGGIYHFSPEELPAFMVGAEPDDILADEILNAPVDSYVPGLLPELASPMDETEIGVPELSNGLLRKARRQKSGEFDTRLLSPLMDVAMGLANLATPADHYDFKPIRPYLPYGRIRQQYERYNPIDQNLVTNQMRAQANANMRALRNAGLGPSLGANLLAADYATNQNLGNALTNVWDANNQRYNQVIQQNNAADAAIANYDWQVEAARANALNQFLPYNQRMALTVDQMNNEAEQDKYNAIAASLNSTKKFLNDYGWERMNRNMVNTNRGNMGYMIDEANRVYYDPNTGRYYRYGCGGTLLKNHKK